MHDHMGETASSSDFISSKNGAKEEVAIADLIKGAFGLAAAKGAVQVYPNSTEDDFGDHDRADDQRTVLPESSDYNTDLQVDLQIARKLFCTFDFRFASCVSLGFTKSCSNWVSQGVPDRSLAKKPSP
jgi:hypothetical protein